MVISVNWGVFIWASTHDHVVDTSLGYFINPLVLIGLGVRGAGRAAPSRAVGAAWRLPLAAVVGLTIDYGRPPLGSADAGLLVRHVRPDEATGRRSAPSRA